MPEVLPFVTELGDEDARWLQCVGRRWRVRAGEEIATEGLPDRHLLVVIEGEFEASSVAGGPVRAATDGVLLCIRLEEVEAKLAGDPTFRDRLEEVIAKAAPRRRRPPEKPAAEAVDGAAPNAAEFHVPDVIKKLLCGDI
ncbi:MAG TPA: hypothetical protein VM890_00305 [Longimicrobium sp.]|nr:hypothetical protein [Longimicrobium sp.]